MTLIFKNINYRAIFAPEIVWDVANWEVVLINLESGEYFSMNKCASDIWVEGLTHLNLFSLESDYEERIKRFVAELMADILPTSRHRIKHAVALR